MLKWPKIHQPEATWILILWSLLRKFTPRELHQPSVTKYADIRAKSTLKRVSIEIYFAESGINWFVILKGRGAKVLHWFPPHPLRQEALSLSTPSHTRFRIWYTKFLITVHTSGSRLYWPHTDISDSANTLIREQFQQQYELLNLYKS